MKTIILSLIISSIFLSQILHADEFTTTDGDHYSGTVKRVDPDGIVLTTADGYPKIYFKNLPPDVAKKYGYDPAKAAQYQKQKGEIAAQVAEGEKKKAADKAAAAALQQNAVFRYFIVESILPNGLVVADQGTYQSFYIEGKNGNAEGDKCSAWLARAGTFTYPTVLGSMRTLQKWVVVPD